MEKKELRKKILEQPQHVGWPEVVVTYSLKISTF
jgi:hypothetical protein